MGVVYEAYDREREVVVALKTMQHANSESIGQLKNEFRALADVVHPNLVELYELTVEGDQIFFTMELVEGMSFLDWVWRRDRNCDDDPAAVPDTPGRCIPEPLPLVTQSTRTMVTMATGESNQPSSAASQRPALDLRRLRDTAKQLALGIGALHDAGKLHRDLKPSNVMVDGGRAVILDFGLVEELDDTDRTGDRPEREGRLLGTAPYMSPEQCARLRGSPASDWYGLGGILFKALTGRAPFLGTSCEIVSDKQRFAPPAPSELAADIPEDLDALVVDLLRRDPHARPRASEVLRRLGVAAEPRTETSASQAPNSLLVGRERELAQLEGALEQVRGGNRQLVRVHGASGCGKSALVERFLDQLEPEDCLVLRGRCYERESLPYKALDPIMEQLARVIADSNTGDLLALATDDAALAARIFPSLHRLEGDDDDAASGLGAVSFELRRRAFAAVRRIFARLAHSRTVVLFIDDLQWGDADSAPLIDELVSHPRAPALLVIVAHRDEGGEATPLITHVAEQAASDINIGPLPDTESEALAQGLLRAAGLPLERAAEIAREARGHPFFTHELVRLASAGDIDIEVGLSVDRVIEQRVLQLPREVHRFLATTAIAGSPTPIGIVASAAQVKGAELMKAVNLLRARQLVRTSGARQTDTVEPYHDRVGETLVGLVAEAETRARHRALAHALLDTRRADPEALARHFLGAGDVRRGVEFSLEAAAAAERTMAFAGAARLYQQALDRGSFSEDRRRTLYESLGAALGNAGLGAEAAQAYLTAADGTDATQALEFHRRAAMHNLCSGHLTEGMEQLKRVLNQAGFSMARSPRRALLRLLLLRMRLRLRGLGISSRAFAAVSNKELTRADISRTVAYAFGLYDVIRASEFHSRALLLALGTGDPGRVALALALEIFVEATGGHRTHKRSQRLLTKLEQLTEESGDPLLQWVNAARTGIAFGTGDFEAALEGSNRTLDLLGNLPGTNYEATTIALFGLWSLYFLGRWRELDERLGERVTEARQRGDLYTRDNLRTGVLNAVWLMRDQPERGSADLVDSMRPWPERRFHLQHHWATLAECQTALYQDQPQRAWSLISRAWGPFHRAMFNRMEVVRIEAEHLRARAAVAVARADPRAPSHRRCLRQAERATRRLDRETAPWASALATLIRASAAHAQEDTGAAIELLDKGIERCEACALSGYANAARIRRASWGGEDAREAREAFAREGVVDPERLARMMVP